MRDAVRVKAYESWNMSVSQFFGKSPRVDMICGNCHYGFSKRFNVIDFDHGFPQAICPSCRKVNYVPMTYK